MSLCALGGAPLEGHNLARFLYVDEAGLGNPKEEPFLVVAGILVHGDMQLNKLYKAVEAVGDLMPQECRDQSVVLHAGDIYGGNGRFDEKRHPEWKGKRMPILQALASVLRDANIQVATGAIIRADFSYKGLKLAPSGKEKTERTFNATVAAHTLCYMACLFEADIWLRKNCKHENCMVIAENNNEARAAMQDLQRFHQSKAMPVDSETEHYFPLRRIRESPAFQDKAPDHPLVLADFAAFILKRQLMRDPKADALLGPWRAKVMAGSMRKDAPQFD